MLSPVTLRSATTSDAPLIATISRQTFSETFNEHNTPENMALFMSSTFSTEKLISEVLASPEQFVLATADGQVAGYLRIANGNQPPEIVLSKPMEICRLYVLREMIGKGIGQVLMNEALRLAAEHDILDLWLGVWEHNERAIRFYRSFGFERFGEHPFLLGTDVQTDWLMKRQPAQK